MVTVTVKSSTSENQEVMANILSGALKREHAILERSLVKTEAYLQDFEKRYGMPSSEFFARYQNGEIDDHNDFVDWAGEYHFYMSIREQLDCLEGMSF